MKEVSAAGLRQSIARLAKHLERNGEPILLKVGQRPAGVIISMRDFHERFAMQKAADERRALVADILGERVRTNIDLDTVLDEVRSKG